MHKLFKYSIHYQRFIKMSIILSINSIYISYFTISILWAMESSQLGLSKDFWSISDSLYSAIKNACKLILRCSHEEGEYKIFHWMRFQCLFLCVQQFLIYGQDYYVLTKGWLYFALFHQCNYLCTILILHNISDTLDAYLYFWVLNKDFVYLFIYLFVYLFMFFVFQLIANLNLPFVNL